MRKSIELYHFTSFAHLAFILEEGLSKGDVPISPSSGTNGIWLTRDGDPSRQRWCSSSFVLIGGKQQPLDKTAVRLTVTLPREDHTLFRWDKVAKLLGIAPEYYERLNSTGGGGGKDWYVYAGVITPDHIKRVELKNGSGWYALRDRSSVTKFNVKFSTMSEQGLDPGYFKIPFPKDRRLSAGCHQSS